jgi:hypothetical protein
MFTAALQAGPLKTKGARKKTFLFCLVNFLKTPNKTPSASAAMAEGGVKKNVFFCFVFYRLNKTDYGLNSPALRSQV